MRDRAHAEYDGTLRRGTFSIASPRRHYGEGRNPILTYSALAPIPVYNGMTDVLRPLFLVGLAS